MPVVSLIITLAIIGVVLWLINTYVPMQPTVKKILNIVAIIAVVIWLLTVFGVIGNLSTIRIG